MNRVGWKFEEHDLSRSASIKTMIHDDSNKNNRRRNATSWNGPNAEAKRDKPESVIRPHLLRFVIPSCFLPALVRLPASALSLHLAVARYAFDETSAHLLNNRTKSDKDSNDRFGFKEKLIPNRNINKLFQIAAAITVFWRAFLQCGTSSLWQVLSSLPYLKRQWLRRGSRRSQRKAGQYRPSTLQ